MDTVGASAMFSTTGTGIALTTGVRARDAAFTAGAGAMYLSMGAKRRKTLRSWRDALHDKCWCCVPNTVPAQRPDRRS